MDNKLRFELTPLPHPFVSDPSSRLEAWGQLVVKLINPSGQTTLHEYQWNLDELAEWFAEHQGNIRSESLPQWTPPWIPLANESLSETLARYWLLIPDISDEDEFFNRREALRLYKASHSLARAMAGSGVLPIIIGCKDSDGEISLCIEALQPEDDEAILERQPLCKKSWAYQFDMVDFCHDLKQALHLFLADWSDKSTDPMVHKRAHSLIKSLGEDPADGKVKGESG